MIFQFNRKNIGNIYRLQDSRHGKALESIQYVCVCALEHLHPAAITPLRQPVES